MAVNTSIERAGIYNIDYFSGAQVSVYIGDIWVDEVTSIQFSTQQSRTPLYGYSSQLWDDVSEGQFIVSGSFTINFKEAGYMYLILNRYRELMKGGNSLLTPFEDSELARQGNIEQITNGEVSAVERNRYFAQLANMAGVTGTASRVASKSVLDGERNPESLRSAVRGLTSSTLGGFSSTSRSRGGVGKAENLFEQFEDKIWGKSQQELDQLDRRADDARLNSFDIFIAYGDFAGDNSVNHTIEKLSQVTILGKSKLVKIDGMPIQEQYSFIARNLV